MKISIVTPCYNSGRFIEETIRSVMDQNYSDMEHIVIDGLSTDGTADILAKYPHLKVVSERDSGQTNALNKGLAMATGDILAWQNADDYYLPGTFGKVLAFFKENPEIGLVYANYKAIDVNGNPISNGTPPEYSRFLFQNGRFAPVQPTVFFRKEVWQKCQPLDEQLHFCMDVDFYAKAINLGFGVKKMPEFLGAFRVHDDSKTSNLENRLAHEQEYFEVLSLNFKFNWQNQFLFRFFKYRARLGRWIKLSLYPRLGLE